MPGIRLVLAPDATLAPDGVRRGSTLTGGIDPLLAAALAAGVPTADLPPDGPARAALDRLHRRLLLAWRIDGVAEAAPLLPGVALPDPTAFAAPASATASVPLSRFALVRREDAAWLLESGRSDWRVRLTARGVAALGDPGVLGADTGPLLGLLAAADLLDDRDDEPAARRWTHHERWFAARSRRDPAAYSSPDPATRGEPEPAARPDPPDARRVRLPVPTGPAAGEPSLWDAGESRRSVRGYADAPVPLAALGALLWRTLRVVRVRPRDGADPGSYEAVWRPVGSGGAMHATDLWLACMDVDGLEPGVYRYDPFAHELVGVATPDGTMGGFVAGFGASTGGRLGVLGLLTARHARTAWKYGGLAYALELKDVGVILHALQLTAGATGLALCPLGSGPTAPIAHLLGIDLDVDTPVGEFLLGVAPDAAAPSP